MPYKTPSDKEGKSCRKKGKKKIKSLCEYVLKKDIYRVDHRIFEM